MLKTLRIKLNSMKRSKQFVLINPLQTPNVEVTAASTALGTSITNMETIAGGREEGTGMFHGASQQRQFAKKDLRKALSQLSAVSKNLDMDTYPDVAAQLKMSSHGGSYQALLDFGRAAVAVVEPIKAVFIAHGSAATVIEDLEARIAAVDSAGNRKATGLDRQIGKTVALKIEARKGMTQVRKLDSILSQLYADNPELYAAWKAAKRQERLLPNEEETEVPGSGSGSGTSPLVGSGT